MKDITEWEKIWNFQNFYQNWRTVTGCVTDTCFFWEFTYKSLISNGTSSSTSPTNHRLEEFNRFSMFFFLFSFFFSVNICFSNVSYVIIMRKHTSGKVYIFKTIFYQTISKNRKLYPLPKLLIHLFSFLISVFID